jgi:N-acetylmuramoyl-L-alanine amidase
MMRTVLPFFIFIGFIFSILSFNKHPQNFKAPKIRTIIIDPGHGGADHGTHGLISTEKDITLEISLKLGKAIQEEYPDMKIVYTRTSDVLPGGGDDYRPALRVRAEIANKAKGDLFICVHCNSNGHPAGGYYEKRVIGHKKKTVYVGSGKKKHKKVINAPIYESYWVKNMHVGTESYIWKADRSGYKADAINERDNDEGGADLEDSTITAVFDMNSAEAKIRAQLYEKKFFDNSFLFASMVEEEFKKAGRESWGVKQRDKGIQVLQATGMPSVLIETGFLTNKEEEEYLNSDKGQEEVVEEILNALRRYKDTLESTRNSSGAVNTPQDQAEK